LRRKLFVVDCTATVLIESLENLSQIVGADKLHAQFLYCACKLIETEFTSVLDIEILEGLDQKSFFGRGLSLERKSVLELFDEP